MSRLRLTATVDKDAVSPDSINAAMNYLVRGLAEAAEDLGLAPNWNSLHVHTRRTRQRDHRVIAWVKVPA